MTTGLRLDGFESGGANIAILQNQLHALAVGLGQTARRVILKQRFSFRALVFHRYISVRNLAWSG